MGLKLGTSSTSREAPDLVRSAQKTPSSPANRHQHGPRPRAKMILVDRAPAQTDWDSVGMVRVVAPQAHGVSRGPPPPPPKKGHCELRRTPSHRHPLPFEHGVDFLNCGWLPGSFCSFSVHLSRIAHAHGRRRSALPRQPAREEMTILLLGPAWRMEGACIWANGEGVGPE